MKYLKTLSEEGYIYTPMSLQDLNLIKAYFYNGFYLGQIANLLVELGIGLCPVLILLFGLLQEY